jgi:hypothetical protein
MRFIFSMLSLDFTLLSRELESEGCAGTFLIILARKTQLRDTFLCRAWSDAISDGSIILNHLSRNMEGDVHLSSQNGRCRCSGRQPLGHSVRCRTQTLCAVRESNRSVTPFMCVTSIHATPTCFTCLWRAGHVVLCALSMLWGI